MIIIVAVLKFEIWYTDALMDNSMEYNFKTITICTTWHFDCQGPNFPKATTIFHMAAQLYYFSFVNSIEKFCLFPSYLPGKHEGQVYIQTSEPFNPAQENVVARIDDVSGKAVAQRFRKITWRPYLTSSPSRTPIVVTKELAVWNPLEYPFGKLRSIMCFRLFCMRRSFK